MTGLERIDVLVYADIDLSPIAVDEPWIGPLFNLQHGANGLRDLKIHVFPVCGGFYARQPGSPHNLQPHARSAQTDQLDTLLQDMIKKGVEEHTPKNCAVEPTTDQEAPEASTV